MTAATKKEIEPKLPAVLSGLPATDSAALAAAGMAGLIEKLAQNPDIDVLKMQALLDMQLGIWDRMAKMAFARDFSAMSLVLPRVVKTKSVAYDIDKNNKAAGQKEAFTYAVIEDIDAVVRPILPQFGFTLSFTSKVRDGGGLISVAKLTHRDGHESVCELPLAIDTSGGKSNLQGMGSTASYGIRYGYKILLNLITIGADNDGEGDPVSNEQAVEIDMLLTETKSDRARFLKWIGASDVQSILAKDYSKAVAELNKKMVVK